MRLPKFLDPLLTGRENTITLHKSGPVSQILIAEELLKQGRDVVIVVPADRQLQQMRSLLSLSESTGPENLLESRKWIVFPSFDPENPEADSWAARWRALVSLHNRSGARGVLLSVENFIPKWPPVQQMDEVSIILHKDEEMLPEMVLEQLVQWGYKRVPMVTAAGEIAMRGDILDVYSPLYEHPVRVEFFGDQIETIRLFNVSSQRSLDDLNRFYIAPVCAALLTEENVAKAREYWGILKKTGEINQQVFNTLLERAENGDGSIHPGLFYPNPDALREHLPDNAVFILSDAQDLRSKAEEGEWKWQEYLEALPSTLGGRVNRNILLWPEREARKAWVGKSQLVFENLVLGTEREGSDLVESSLESFDELFWQPEQRRRPWVTLVAAFKQWQEQKKQVVLTFHTARSRKKFLHLAEQEELPVSTEYRFGAPGIYAIIGSIRRGADLPWADFMLLPEGLLQPGSGEKRLDNKDFKGVSSFDEIQADDLLVHKEYGLARFGGLTRVAIGDVANDYLLLQFDGDDKLYIPVDRLNVVQRYKGPEGTWPSLDSLRGTRWAKTKERARKAIEKIAHELVEMYAYRRIAKGYAYDSPNELYWEFEAGFGFEETPDQAKAIADVLADMEKPEPMDRLVCGDVGFGKTEVAMRAAFRAVAAGKQVALLCPTTILAEQHHLNFKKRLKDFPVKVGMLSRFVPKAEQKTVVQAASKGLVDILIGTHRLLSKDVDMPDLGLLILDEEQRFGVKHKEKLKEMKKNIDALTLTATPIPRTLQLSLSGIRSLSTIETPPVDRKPVETALIERKDEVLAGIIKREIDRGGQVFWVHNRVRTLDGVMEYVKSLVPDARVGMGHGQMTATALEDTMHSFWHGELDVLVCTAIVESGLDFPNANTIVVDQAQMFGLGQLYQLRGRVGRSDRQAHAYFVVPDLDSLSGIAKKRLQVILDMDYLGAGFRIAMEDLRLRGAGNILGEAQSGQMAKVGLDLFLEMLEEEVARLKGEDIPEHREAEINFVFPANIPEGYIPDPSDRLKYYKRLAACKHDDELLDVINEIRDRFGAIPEALDNLLAVFELKWALKPLGVSKADLFPNRAVLHWPDGAETISPDAVIKWLQSRSDWAKILPPAKLETRLPAESGIRSALRFLATELEQLT